jgi:hypothetical protein
MSEVFISPRYKASDLLGASLERKVDVFADQTQGWLLDQAKVLASSVLPTGQHAGYAVLALCVVYVESIACFLKGASSDNKSREFFDFGLTHVFTDLNQTDLNAFSKEFYREVRCGLLHQGLPQGKISITRGAQSALAIVTDSTTNALRHAVIDPWIFLMHVETHFSAYMQRMKDPNEAALRVAFETWFEARAV